MMTTMIAGLAAVGVLTGGLPAGEDLRRELDGVVAAGAVNAMASVVADGRRIDLASGVADVRTGRPTPVDGSARIGSTTKTFVATVVLQLVGEGRLRLSDPVERHLPGLVPGGGAITVGQLLSHTSGLRDHLADPSIPMTGRAFLTETRFRTFRPAELVAIATSQPPHFAPGAGFRYSNTGYVLAGMVVERVTGRPYGEEIERRLLRPLGLRDTVVPGRSVRVPGPHPHGYLAEPFTDVTLLNPSWASSAGEMISTPSDLNRFFAALLDGRLLRPAELAVMRTAVATDPQGVGYGMGLWSQTRACGVTVWGHGGRLPGYKTTVLRSDDGRRQLALVYSPGSPDGVAEFLAAEALIDRVFC